MTNEWNERYLTARKKLIAGRFAKLNDRQREAVMTTEGPLLLLAGAGSGKTTVLIHRIANLLWFGAASDSAEIPAWVSEQDVEYLEDCAARGELDPKVLDICRVDAPAPWNIIAITFTNKAAGELKTRLEAMLGAEANDVWAMTFHSACCRILRRDAEKLGYTSRFTIYDTADSERVMKDVLHDMGLDDKSFPAKTVLNYISKAKDQLLLPDGYAEMAHAAGDFRLERIARAYADYQKRLMEANAMDFDDLILQTVRLLRADEQVRSFYQRKFRYVLIDEYQDTNNLQYLLASLLAGRYENICVVGDDDQSIYRFRGATIENILSFEEQYKGAKVIRLEQNYRSTNTILKAANCVIANNKERHVKNLWSEQEAGQPITAVLCPDETQEAEFITQSIQDAHLAERRPWKEFAVLFRSNRQSRALEDAFKKARIPHVLVGTTSFYQAKEILDAGAFLQAAANPGNDLAFMRIVNVPPRGIGDATIEKLRQARELQHRPMQLLARDERLLSAIPPEAAAALRTLTAALREARHAGETPCQLAPLASRLFQAVDYMDGIVRMYKPRQNALERRENVMEFLSMLADFDARHMNRGTLSMLLDQLDLEDAGDHTSDRKKPQPDAVTLMTVHASKGLEFPVVYLAGMERNLFPHQRAVEEGNLAEERRLFYVAITRAKKRLWLTYAAKRREGQAMLPRVPSPFLDELPDDCLQYCKPQDTFSKISQQEALDILLCGKDLF